MTLADYLERTGTPRREFAASLGISEALLSRLVNRRRAPTFTMAMKIIHVTDGAVRVEDMTAVENVPAPAEGADL